MQGSPEFEARLAGFVQALDAHIADVFRRHYPATYARKGYPHIELQRGPKYIRVVARESDGGGGSAHSFLDYQGNIYKPAGWKTPAKHVRGSIFDDNFSVGKGVTHTGAAYIRR